MVVVQVETELTIELTKRYEEIVKKYSVEEWAPEDSDFKEFMKGLTSIQAMSVCPGCLKAGGESQLRAHVKVELLLSIFVIVACVSIAYLLICIDLIAN